MSALILSELWRYPVKSMRGARHARLSVTARGFDGDRNWMLVDAKGRFLTQRQNPRMSLLLAELDAGDLRIVIPEVGSLAVELNLSAPQVRVEVWGDRCLAQPAMPQLNQALSDFLQQACCLVNLPEQQQRIVDQTYAKPQDQVGFADGFPFLLISQASLDDLNARLAAPVPMLRFRPNLVVSGCAPFAEDSWQRIRIGEIEFRVAKPCSRCIIPTIDPNTAERAKEPMQTLLGYRKRDNKVYFGQNLLHDGLGELREGMSVEVLE